MAWQRTIGPRVGAYCREAGAELYVRLDAGGWSCFLDGIGTDRAVPAESEARASLEATLRRRDMIRAGASRLAASTGKPGSATGARRRE